MRIEVSCRQHHRAHAITPNAAPGRGRFGVAASPAVRGPASGVPLPASGVRTSVIGSCPGGHFGEDVAEAGVTGLPMTRPAMWPLRSITSVLGIAAGGTVPRKASAISPAGSFRLG